MKKKATIKTSIVLFLMLIGIASMYACGGDEGKAESKQPSEQVQEDVKTPFEQMETSLTDLGLEFEKTTTAAELVGAEQGMKFALPDGNVEIYRFAEGDAFTKVKTNKSLELEGFGAFPAEIHSSLPLAMMIEDVNKKDDIIKAFTNIQ